MEREAAEILKYALRNPQKYGIDTCSLCAGKIKIVAIFTPTESFARRIGQPPEKQRIIVYGLCEPCSKLPDLAAKVEAAMLRDLGVH